jgi:hypothetical protein
MKKVYPSFPMTHVVDMPDVLAEIDHFRAELAARFITFDPGDVDEKLLLDRALAAAANGVDWVTVTAHPFGAAQAESQLRISVREVLDIAASARVRAHQGGLRGVEAPQDPVAVHHGNGDEGLPDRRRRPDPLRVPGHVRQPGPLRQLRPCRVRDPTSGPRSDVPSTSCRGTV